MFRFPMSSVTNNIFCIVCIQVLICCKWLQVQRIPLLSHFTWVKMIKAEILNAVFPFLDSKDLMSCMAVCKEWKVIAQDDYFWKRLSAKRWPSICKLPNPPTVPYYVLYKTFCRRHMSSHLPLPRLSFEDLEFYIDVWTDFRSLCPKVVPGSVVHIDIWPDFRFLFSKVIPGSVVQSGIKSPPTGSNAMHTNAYKDSGRKLLIPTEPRFTAPLDQDLNVSVLIRRKDCNRVACLIKELMPYGGFWCPRAFPCFRLPICLTPSLPYPALAGIEFLFVEHARAVDVFGFVIDLAKIAYCERELMWLLEGLDWI